MVENRSPVHSFRSSDFSIMWRVLQYLYGGVIFVHKVILDELDGKRTLPYTTCPNHHQLILGHSAAVVSPGQTRTQNPADHTIPTIYLQETGLNVKNPLRLHPVKDRR